MTGMPRQEINLKVNSRPVTAEIDAGSTLLRFLRDDLCLKGAKEGCGEGECGACTVIVNGMAVNSCLMMARDADGCEVITIEGLEQNGEMDALQRAFIDEGAIQCGFCTPGVIMSAKALLMANPCPSEQQVKEDLSGNICRCTGYEKIVRAVRVASGRERAVEISESEDYSVIGRKVRRRDAVDKALGRAVYADDIDMPGMLHGKALRSAHAHALIKSIDSDEARRLPGVHGVFTSRDIPGINRYGVAIPDQPCLADDKVRCYGDAVALVVAESEEIAAAAAGLIKADYEELPGVFTPKEGLQPGAPAVHEKGNLLQRTKLRKGDVIPGFEQCAVIVEGAYQTQCIEHAYMEPECSVASLDHQGTLTVWTSTQYVFRDRRQIAAVMGLPINKVRVIQMTTGGGFGGKDDITTENLAALGAIKTGRPVKVRFTREESMRATTKRHPMLIEARLGADSEGRLLALEGTVYGDKGAYSSLGPFVIKKTGLHLGGPYYIPNIKTDTYSVYTNNPPCGAMRGFGVLQASVVHESLIDILAERLGMDPWEIRYKNALAPGLSTSTGHVLYHSIGIRQTLAEIKRYLTDHPPEGRPESPVKKRGIGYGCMMYALGYGFGRPDAAAATLEIGEDGTVTVLSGCAEIGQGSTEVIALVAAEELGILAEDICVLTADTAITPDAGCTSASRQTYVTGNAVRKAAGIVKQSLLECAGEMLGADPRGISFKKREVFYDGKKTDLTIGAVANYCRSNGHQFIGMGWFNNTTPDVDHETSQGDAYGAYTFASQAAEVEVDTETGEVEVLRVVAAHDVGQAINPLAIEGQIEGGVAMGIGYALTESLILDRGMPMTPTLAEYILPTTQDVPPIKSIIVEDKEPTGPFGAKGVGEPATIPTAPAIFNAIHDAVGIRITELPATPEKVRRLLKEKQGQAPGNEGVRMSESKEG